MTQTSSILDANAFTGTAADGSLVRRREQALGPAYRLFYREPVELVRGSGVHLFDAEGREYLDAYNNVACVGHAHPRVVEAVSRQVGRLTTHTRYLDAALVTYAERLLATFPAVLDRVMLTCTGSEANDLALRLAFAATGGTGVIVTEEAYHGNTALVTGTSPSLGAGAPLGEHVWTVPAPDPVRRPGTPAEVAVRFTAAVDAALEEMAAAGVRPAALLVDTILSSDGVHADPAGPGGLLAGAVAAVRRAGGVLVADEVQPGFARTGEHVWGFERHGLVPEIATLGKPMGGGLPIAGVVAQEAVLTPFAGTTPYFNTFGGSHVSIAAATAVLDVIEGEGLQQRALEVGAVFAEALREVAARHPVVADVRGAGLYLGVELVDLPGGAGVAGPAADDPGALASDVVNGMRERGVLTSVCGRFGTTLKVRPPLVFSTADVERYCTELDAVLDDLGR